jgi:hypothetical protein
MYKHLRENDEKPVRLDLGPIVPPAVLPGILLLRRSPWGYLPASVALSRGVTLGLGVSAMLGPDFPERDRAGCFSAVMAGALRK